MENNKTLTFSHYKFVTISYIKSVFKMALAALKVVTLSLLTTDDDGREIESFLIIYIGRYPGDISDQCLLILQSIL